MAITFSPAGIDFGGVETGSSSQLTLTITNSGSADVIIAAPTAAGFSMSPGPETVPAGGAVTVLVTFTPTAKVAYAGTLVGAGTASCALAGFGQSDADKFEDDADTAGDKHYQIVVPNFSLNGSAAAPGTSFLRMGSFPDLTQPSAFPTGFQRSLDLASTVGNATAIGSTESADLTPETSLTKTSFNGDPNYMLGFADDTRSRPGDTAGTSWAARRDLTQQLLTRGGWWEHSDGNRISTTVGDRIDIIQGNYKMVVMGRQAPPTYPAVLGNATLEASYWTAATQAALATLYATKNAKATTPAALVGSDVSADTTDFPGISAADATAVATKYGQQQAYGSYISNDVLITDISGGLMSENGPSPTHCIKSIEYHASEDGGTWDVYQNNGIGNVMSSFYGDVRDVFFGPHKESWTGKAPDGDYAGTSDFYKKSLSMHPDAGNFTEDPIIEDHVWAKSITSYKGSKAKPVPSISDTTHATNISAEVNADKVTSTTNVSTATVYSEINDTPGGNIISMIKAASITNLTAAGHIMDMSIALRTAINVGLCRDIFLGGKFAFSFGMGHEIRVGPKFELITSGAETINLAEGDEFTVGGKVIAATMLLLGM